MIAGTVGAARDRQMDQKMSTEPLTRSEVFGQLRRELYGDKQSTHSPTHIFIILGASVSTNSELLTT